MGVRRALRGNAASGAARGAHVGRMCGARGGRRAADSRRGRMHCGESVGGGGEVGGEGEAERASWEGEHVKMPPGRKGLVLSGGFDGEVRLWDNGRQGDGEWRAGGRDVDMTDSGARSAKPK